MKKLCFIFTGLLISASVFPQWSLTGNSGTNPAINFVGTTDSKSLIFKSFNIYSGYVGAGDATAFGKGALETQITTRLIPRPNEGQFIENTAIGYYALFSTQTFGNTACGAHALEFCSAGSYNTAVGGMALQSTTAGCYNTCIGYDSGINSASLFNTTVIGSCASVTASNWVRIGDVNVTRIEGQVNFTGLSDGRIKKNVLSNVPGLEFIKKLQPVTYTMDLNAMEEITKSKKRNDIDPAIYQLDKEAREAKEKIVYTGFIAQDVERAAQSIGFDFSGVDAPANEKSLYGLRYAEFVVPLVKAVQELSDQNTTLQNQVEKLSELVNILLSREESDPLPDKRISSVTGASLEQNKPNPFTSSATIAYTLPQSFRSAKIVITAMSGEELKQIPLFGSGAGSLTITAGSFSAGMYYYSLYVDDMLVCTKRMIIIT